MMRKGYVVAMAMGLILSTTAIAQQTGGVTVGGNLDLKGDVNNSNNTATQGGKAQLDVGTLMEGTNIKGNANVTGIVRGTANNTASGEGSVAKTAIGVVNSKNVTGATESSDSSNSDCPTKTCK